MTDDGKPPAFGEVGLEMVLPFVACQTQGGPYDDQAFAAGFSAGEIWTALAVGRAVGAAEVTPGMGAVRRTLVPQVDLIAAHHGYRWVEQDEQPGPPAAWAAAVAAEWVSGTFQRTPGGGGE